MDRIFKLIEACRYSFHDLSLVKLDRKRPTTPRFNMPFELGLVIGWQNPAASGHEWSTSRPLADLLGRPGHFEGATFRTYPLPDGRGSVSARS